MAQMAEKGLFRGVLPECNVRFPAASGGCSYDKSEIETRVTSRSKFVSAARGSMRWLRAFVEENRKRRADHVRPFKTSVILLIVALRIPVLDAAAAYWAAKN
jgi:hypothetical protein